MTERTFTRRGFVKGCSATIAAMAGSSLGQVAFGDLPGEFNQEALVIVFLRGGCDSLNLVSPIAGVDRGHYEEARPELQVPASGDNAALPGEDHWHRLAHPTPAKRHKLTRPNRHAGPFLRQCAGHIVAR